MENEDNNHCNGLDCLKDPFYNRDTLFSLEERKELNLEGLLPPAHETLETQQERVFHQIQSQTNSLDKYAILHDLASTNQLLYYKVLDNYLKELIPIVYTPVVGEGCQNYHYLYKRPIGMYISAFDHKGRFKEVLQNWPHKNVEIMVVTDGGRILGIGDLGTNGMGISVGKISLYVVGGGFSPNHTLPICLDCGTDTVSLLENKFYLGARKPRIKGEALLEVIKEFVEAVNEVFPKCLIQFEDFQSESAFSILDRFRDEVLCFNDDIQGTAAVVLSGLRNAIEVQNSYKRTHMSNIKILFYGAGSAACGIAQLIVKYFELNCNMTKDQAYKTIFLVDSKGLVSTKRGDELVAHKIPFARKEENIPLDLQNLNEIINYVKPNALLGLAGKGPAFDESCIQAMCECNHRPIVFALSNPTSKAEITADDAIYWSQGKVLFASGSPFDPVEYNGDIYEISQANNLFIFPGVGFGATKIGATKITDTMLISAAKALAKYVKENYNIQNGQLYPDISDLRMVSVKIATHVAECAADEGVIHDLRLRNKKNYSLMIIQELWSPKNEV